MLRVFVKALCEPEVTLKSLPHTALESVEELCKHLLKNAELAKRLKGAYPHGGWRVLNLSSKPIELGGLVEGMTVLLGKESEPLRAPLSIKVKHQPHHNVMTESAAHFHDSGGKKPARLLFCEFIDNSIEALRRGVEAKLIPQPTPKQMHVIDIHLIYFHGTYNTKTKSQVHLQARG